MWLAVNIASDLMFAIWIIVLLYYLFLPAFSDCGCTLLKTLIGVVFKICRSLTLLPLRKKHSSFGGPLNTTHPDPWRSIATRGFNSIRWLRSKDYFFFDPGTPTASTQFVAPLSIHFSFFASCFTAWTPCSKLVIKSSMPHTGGIVVGVVFEGAFCQQLYWRLLNHPGEFVAILYGCLSLCHT